MNSEAEPAENKPQKEPEAEPSVLKLKDQIEIAVFFNRGHEQVGFEWEGTTVVFLFEDNEATQALHEDFVMLRCQEEVKLLRCFRQVHNLIRFQREKRG